MFVQDWTQSHDYDPFSQIPLSHDKSEPNSLGGYLSEVLSTNEFFTIKKYQVDQEINEIVHPLFNPNNYMFYVDFMGNLLSNLKLAFYEYKEQNNFISKMLHESNENTLRETLIKSY